MECGQRQSDWSTIPDCLVGELLLPPQTSVCEGTLCSHIAVSIRIYMITHTQLDCQNCSYRSYFLLVSPNSPMQRYRHTVKFHTVSVTTYYTVTCKTFFLGCVYDHSLPLYVLTNMCGVHCTEEPQKGRNSHTGGCLQFSCSYHLCMPSCLTVIIKELVIIAVFVICEVNVLVKLWFLLYS